jgi:hypothetical protein
MRCALAAIGVREKKHVRHDAGHALQIFKIGSQDIAQLVGIAGLAQSQLATADERGQRVLSSWATSALKASICR